MSTDSIRKRPQSEFENHSNLETPSDINTVTITYVDGSIEQFSLIVRGDDSDWIYGERCVDIRGEFVEESLVSIKSDQVRQIESDCIHLFDGGVMHHGESFLLDPATILEESWYDSNLNII